MAKLKYYLYICNRKLGSINLRGLSWSHKTTENQSDMMTANEEGRCLKHDTTMCGDPKVWFPMRVTYSRELKVKAELDRLEIENFVPMTFKLIDDDTDNPHRELVPAINNLIFVRSTQERISHLKSSNKVLHLLRYMLDQTAQKAHTIMTIADRQMENFMRVASGPLQRGMQLTTREDLLRQGFSKNHKAFALRVIFESFYGCAGKD